MNVSSSGTFSFRDDLKRSIRGAFCKESFYRFNAVVAVLFLVGGLCSCRLVDNRIKGSLGLGKDVQNTLPLVTLSSPSPLSGDSSTTFDFPVTYTGALSVNLTLADVTVNAVGTSCDTPTILNGTSSTPTVELANCTGSGTLGIQITAGTSQNAEGGDIGSSVSSTVTISNTCPLGYILVPSDGTYTFDDFCVMKYEAKLQYDSDGDGDFSNATIVSDGNFSGTYDYDTDYDTASSLAKYKAVSEADGRPWVNIKRGENGSSTGQGAIEACEELNTQEGVSNKYDLISNDEWQTIAHNIAAQTSNWGTDSYGDTVLNHGHADSDPNQTCDGRNEYVDTDCDNSGNETDFAERRTDTLSNSEEIWDLAGNALEWAKDNYTTTTFPNYWAGFTDANADGISDDYATVQHDLGPLDLTPSFCSNPSGNNYCGFGYSSSSMVTDGVLRGGGLGLGLAGADSGVFAINLTDSPAGGYSSVGFRCVFQP